MTVLILNLVLFILTICPVTAQAYLPENWYCTHPKFVTGFLGPGWSEGTFPALRNTGYPALVGPFWVWKKKKSASYGQKIFSSNFNKGRPGLDSPGRGGQTFPWRQGLILENPVTNPGARLHSENRTGAVRAARGAIRCEIWLRSNRTMPCMPWLRSRFYSTSIIF